MSKDALTDALDRIDRLEKLIVAIVDEATWPKGSTIPEMATAIALEQHDAGCMAITGSAGPKIQATFTTPEN